MTEKERIKRIAELRAELKELLATPRSDWHAAFEALLRIETYKFENRVHIRTEEEIGIMPPRTDFVLLIEDEQVEKYSKPSERSTSLNTKTRTTH